MIKYLFIFLVSTSAYSFDYWTSEALLCEKKQAFSTEKQCQDTYTDCVLIPGDFQCESFTSVEMTEVPDRTRPILSKFGTVSCSGKKDCNKKLKKKKCKNAFVNQGFTEVYCVRRDGFRTKQVKKYVKNVSAHESFMANRNTEKTKTKNINKAFKQACKNIVPDTDEKKVLKFICRRFRSVE